MGEAYLDYQKGGKGGKLNDIIEDFKYVYKGQSVKAGDFVNYIKGVAGVVDYGTSTDTQIRSQFSTDAYAGYVISAVALDDNRVFIAHSWASACYLHGVVVTINGTTITVGTDTRLNTTTGKAKYISAVALDDSTVFIAHNQGSYDCLYGMACTISGTTITAGSDYELDATNYSGRAISSVALGDNKVFVAHSQDSKYYLYGIVVTVSGTTITKGSNTSISGNSYSGNSISTTKLNNGDIFIAHNYSNSTYHLYGIVASVSGTTISKGTSTVISNGAIYTALKPSSCLLEDGRVFIAHNYNNSNYYLYGIVCTVSDKTITAGTDTALITSRNYAGYSTSVLALKNKVLIFCNSEGTSASEMYLYGLVAEVSGTTITTGADTQLSTTSSTAYALSPLILTNGSIFLAHSYSTDYLLYAQIWGVDEANNIPTNHITATEYETQVTPATESPFNAIALSSGEGGDDTAHKDQVKIARVYREIEVPQIINGNIFPHTAEAWSGVVEETKYSTNDGYILEASSAYPTGTLSAYLACDGNTGTCWRSGGYSDSTIEWLMMTCPEPKKITKMKTRIYGDIYNAVIQGSQNGTSWTNLYTLSAQQNALAEISLENADFYTYYRIYIKLTAIQANAFVDEWQVSAYEGIVTEVIT